MDTISDANTLRGNSWKAAVIRWTESNDDIRAALLTSARAPPEATLDRWSDYDVLLIVRKIDPLLADKSWIDTFGDVVVAYWDPLEVLDGGCRGMRMWSSTPGT